jgi:7-keto-8-aminopelargonate synthetase-like enzyme
MIPMQLHLTRDRFINELEETTLPAWMKKYLRDIAFSFSLSMSHPPMTQDQAYQMIEMISEISFDDRVYNLQWLGGRLRLIRQN